MMKKILILFVFMFSFLAGNLSAQYIGEHSDESAVNTVNTIILQRIGFVNSNEVLESMPEKAKATAKIEDLNKRYKEELEVMQNDYNKKYSDFMSYQNTMANNIRLRRMQELYELERHIEEFMKLAQGDIESHEQELIVPLRNLLKEAIKSVGVEHSFVCIYDLANPTIVFVTPDAKDITPLVKKKLGIK